MTVIAVARSGRGVADRSPVATLSRWPAALLMAAALALLPATAAAQAAKTAGQVSGQAALDDGSVRTLPAVYNSFAFNPQTGDLLAIETDKNSVTLYKSAWFGGLTPPAGTVVGPVVVGQKPAVAVFKQYKGRTVLAVGSREDGHLYLLDPSTLKILESVIMERSVVKCLAASLADDDPLIYYTISAGQSDAWIGRYNLEKKADQKTLTPVGEDRNLDPAASEVSVSADGRYLYTRRDNVSPTGRRCLRKTGGADGEGWVMVKSEHLSTPAYVADPQGLLVASGDQVFSFDMSQEPIKMTFTPLSFVPDKPFIVGRSGNDLVVASRNTMTERTRRALPAKLLSAEKAPVASTAGGSPRRPPTRSSGRSGSRADEQLWVFTARSTGRILVIIDDRLMVTTLQEVGVADEVNLVCRVNGPTTAIVGRKFTLPLELVDPRATLALKSGPAGLQLVGRTLEWSPLAHQAGDAIATLAISGGGQERGQTVNLAVTQPFVVLPFTATGLSVSGSGKLALAWASDSDRTMRGSGAETNTSQLALIDLDKMELIRSATLQYRVSCAALDDQMVYVAQSNADALEALSPKDLTVQKRIVTTGSVSSLTPVASKLLVARTAKVLQAWTVPQLQPITNVAANGVPVEYGLGVDNLSQIADGWWNGSTLFDPDLTRARMIVQPGRLARAPVANQENVRPSAFRGRFGDREGHLPPSPWNRWALGNQLINSADQRLGEIPPVVILDDYPVAVGTIPARGNMGGFPTRAGDEAAMLQVVLYELQTGQPVERITLARPAGNQQRVEQTLMAVAGRRVAVCFGRSVFAVTITDEQLRKCPEPFHLALPTEVVKLDPAKSTVLAHKASGGQGPYKFELPEPTSYMKIDAASGAVTVDGPALTKACAMGFVQGGGATASIYDHRIDKRISRMETPTEYVEALAGLAQKDFKDRCGLTVSNLPLLVRVVVQAQDGQQQAAQLVYHVVLEMPKAPLQAALEQAKVERDKQSRESAARFQQYAEQERQRQATTESARADQGTVKEERIRQLEDRIKELEVKVDMLVKLMTKDSSAPAPSQAIPSPTPAATPTPAASPVPTPATTP